MPDRTVSYSFRGNFSNLSAGLKVAGRNVEELGGKLTALDKNGAKMRAGLTSVGSAAGKVGLVAAAGLGVAVLAAANFDKAMSNVQAATHETAGNMDLLRAAALKAGADTQYSATEAAGAIEALSKAGVSTSDILAGGLTGSLNLAAAGELEVSQAAEIAATTLTQFGLAGDQTSHVADVLAAAAGKAQGEVTDMAQALKYVGPVAAQMGISLEETSGAIAELASQGILGDQAGTSLRGMLTSLTSPSKIAAEQMSNLGINMYDAQGKFVGLDGIAGQLKATMSGLTNAERDQALGRIFGNEQITTARILYAGGADAVQKWTAAVDDQGYAADTAAAKMDNLSGDVEQLKGSLETLFIGAGSGSQGPLRSLTQGATASVNALNKMPGAAQNTVMALLGITAVTGGALWFGSKVVNGVSSTKTALDNLGVAGTRASKAMKAVGIAGAALAGLVIAAQGIRAIQEATDESLPGLNTLSKQLLDLKGGDVKALGSQFDDLGESVDRIANKDFEQKFADTMQTPFKGLFGEASGLRQAKSEIDSLDQALANLVTAGSPDVAAAAFDALASATNLTDAQVSALKENLPGYKEALAGVATSSELAAGGTDNLGGAAGKAQARITALNKAIDEGRKVARKTADSFLEFGNNLDDTKVSLSSWIQSMRQQANALRDFRVNAQRAAKKGLDEGLIASLEKAGPAGALRMKQLANATKSQIAQANGAWRSGQREVERYTDKIGGVPRNVNTNVNVNTGAAFNQISALKYALAALHDKTVTIHTVMMTSYLNKRAGQPMPGGTSADGSTVPKDGGPYGDRYLYLLAPGEEVISNRHGQADRNRALLKAINSNRLADGGTVRGLADGGTATSAHRGDKETDRATRALHGLRTALEKAKKALDAETKVRDALQQKRNDVASSVTSGLRGDIFDASNPWAAGAGNPIAALKASNTAISAFMKDLKHLKAAGLTGPALAEALADPQRAAFMAHMSTRDLKTYQRLYGENAHLLAAAGRASADAAYGAPTRANAKDIREIKQEIRHLTAAVKHADKNNRKGHKDNADHVVNGVNGAAHAGHRRGSR